MSLTLKICNKCFNFDLDDFEKLCRIHDGSTKLINWKLNNDFPYYKDNNNKKVYLINIIMQDICNNNIIFKDNNKYNYKKNNIIVKIDKHIVINDIKYIILEKYKGHTKKYGKKAGIMRNIKFKCKNTVDNCIYYIMKCIDVYTFIPEKYAYKPIKYKGNILTWYYLNGYIASHINYKKTILYLHQYIAEENIENKYNNEKNISIDHINRNKLDNRIENLRYASQTIQNLNQNKRKRQSTAKYDLPEFIKELPKYIEYRKETKREYFVINKHHPSIDKDIKSTTSNKVSLKDKYTQILKIYNNIDNYTMKKKYPKGIYFSKDKFVLDLKKDNNRYNIRMKATKTEENYNKFINNIIKKYSNFNVSYFKN